MKEQEKVFTEIYTNQFWKSGKSVSGAGSEKEATEVLVEKLKNFFNGHNIKSLLDVPCGDLNWVVDLVDGLKLDYIGCDIVQGLIDENRKTFKEDKNYSFHKLDIISDELPLADFLLVRDCLVHLPNELVLKAISNIANSNVKYVGITTFTNREENLDIPLGHWRTLNLTQQPFNLPVPFFTINEDCKYDFPNYNDKSIGIWKIEQLINFK